MDPSLWIPLLRLKTYQECCFTFQLSGPRAIDCKYLETWLKKSSYRRSTDWFYIQSACSLASRTDWSWDRYTLYKVKLKPQWDVNYWITSVLLHLAAHKNHLEGSLRKNASAQGPTPDQVKSLEVGPWYQYLLNAPPVILMCSQGWEL